MSRSALIFKCYQCDLKFASFEAQRTHELFTHGKFVENCNIDLEKQKKAYYEANKDKIAESKKAYYEANKDKIAESQKKNYVKSMRNFVK